MTKPSIEECVWCREATGTLHPHRSETLFFLFLEVGSYCSGVFINTYHVPRSNNEMGLSNDFRVIA